MTDARTEPVTVQEVRDFLHLDADDDDALLARLIPTARAQVEGETGYGLASLSREVTLHVLDAPIGPLSGLIHVPEEQAVWGLGWLVSARVRLPHKPVTAITSVKALYPDTGTWEALNPTCYTFDDEGLLFIDALTPASPAAYLDLAHGLKITYTGGYSRDGCPEPFKWAVMQRVVYMYDGRQPSGIPDPPRRMFL